MTLSVVSPKANSTIILGIPIEILAIIQGYKKIEKIEFYVNNIKINESLCFPYHAFYNPSTVGNLNIKAIALLTDNQVIESDSITLTVLQSLGGYTINFPPTIELLNPVALNVGQTIILTAKGSDDGNITKVEFYANSVKLGEAFSNPYTINWTPAVGDYALTVVAYDDKGAFTTGNPIKVNVGNNPPSVLSVVTEGSNDNVALNSNWLLL